MNWQLSAPQPLDACHLFDGFGSGAVSLDEWLKRKARANQLSRASRTFVVADQASRVFGYYAMAAGAVAHLLAASGVRRNMPDPIPVMVLARLAVDYRAQRMKLGAALLQDCVNRAVAVSKNAGIRALLVHAIFDRAKQFYEYYGFQESLLCKYVAVVEILAWSAVPCSVFNATWLWAWMVSIVWRSQCVDAFRSAAAESVSPSKSANCAAAANNSFYCVRCRVIRDRYQLPAAGI
jgi:GNAT superfamily N-acetyltransferase